MIFLDSAAIVKMIRREAETEALGNWLAAQPDNRELVASALVSTEVPRAVRRADPGRQRIVPTVLSRIDRVAVDETVLATAAAYTDPMLRTLDAIHLASAETLVIEGLEITAFVTYDKRLLSAANAVGLTTAAPGVD